MQAAMAAAGVRNLLLLLAVLGLAAAWPTHTTAYTMNAPTGSASPLVVANRRLLAATNAPAAPATKGATPSSDASVPLTPADSGEMDYAYFGGKRFLVVGESSNVTGRVDMTTNQRNCSELTATLETSDPALQCTPGPFPLHRGGWEAYECHLLSETPSEGPRSLVPFTGPIASCTAVAVAADPVLLTVTVRKGGRVLTPGASGGDTSQLVVITATPVLEADVRILVSPKEAVADAKGSALFQVTVTGLVDCSLATLDPNAGGIEGKWCRGPTDLVQGRNGMCTTKRPIRCRIDLEAMPYDGCESPRVSRTAVTFDVVPKIPDDPRVVNGWGYDTPYPTTWACLREPRNGTKPGTPPSKDGGAPVMPPDIDAAAAPASSPLLPPLSDKAATRSPATSVVAVNDTPAAATSSAPTTKGQVGSGTPPGVADQVPGGIGAGPVDLAAAPALVQASPSGSTVSSSLGATSVTMGPSSDPVPAVAPVAGPDIVAGLSLEAGTLEGGPSSIGAMQKPSPVVQSNMDSSGAAFRLDNSTAGAGTGNTQQQRSPASRASVTAGFCWLLGAVLVLMAAW